MDANASNDLDAIVDVLLDRPLGVDGLALVLHGAGGLPERQAGTPAQCLDTSRTWLLG